MDCDPVDLFQRLFGAEARVDILQKTEQQWTVHFYGNMCYTCGAADYFDDFAHFLTQCTDTEWAVETYTQREDGTYLVVYKPRHLVAKKKRHVKIVIDREEINLEIEDGGPDGIRTHDLRLSSAQL